MTAQDDAIDFGRYRLLRLLGRGGMAEVYLGESVGPMGFRKRVAVKRLLPTFANNARYVRMFLDEARIASAIAHPNVVQVIEFGDVDRLHYMTMEFVDGIDLASVLRAVRESGSFMPIPLALHVARCVADGLHAAHMLLDAEGAPMNVVHRDVSPHNVIVSYDGDVKLIDFGVAKSSTNLTQTRSGIIKGKLQYMSPEQAQALPVDARADVFSLGLTLYKMLTGRLPFRGTNEYQIYDQILRKQPSAPSRTRRSVPGSVDELVLRALSKELDARIQTCQAFSTALGALLAELGQRPTSTQVAEWLRTILPQVAPADLDGDDFTVGDAGPEVEVADPDDVDAPQPTVELSQVHSLDSAHIEWAQDEPDDGAAWMSTRIIAAPEPISVPSVSTAQLSGLRPNKSWRWAAASAAVATLGAVGLGLSSDLVGSEPPAASRSPSRVAPTEPPSGPRSATPTQVSSVSTESPSAPPTQAPTAPPTQAPTDAPKPKPPAVNPAMLRGYVTVTTLPWAWVSIDGVRLARHTPVVAAPVKPGRHVITLEAGDGRRHTLDVTVKAGQRLTLSHVFK